MTNIERMIDVFIPVAFCLNGGTTTNGDGFEKSMYTVLTSVDKVCIMGQNNTRAYYE